MTSRSWLVVLGALVCLSSPAFGQSSVDRADEAFDVLLDTFEAVLQQKSAESDTTTLALVEAETIAEVAAELMEEGETDLATELLGEALALLSPESSPSADSSESP